MFANAPGQHELLFKEKKGLRGGVIEPFPEKLYRLLRETESAGSSDIISFVADGRAFAIHKPELFFRDIIPQYFRQSRLSSFKRQLNLYGFELINSGPARGGYYHKLFHRDQPELCMRMRRVAVKIHPTQRKAEVLPQVFTEKPAPLPIEAEQNAGEERQADSDPKESAKKGTM